LTPFQIPNWNDGRTGTTEEFRGLDAAGPLELPLLEALLAEDRTALSGTEGDRGLLAARRARGLCFHALPGESVAAPASRARHGSTGSLGLAWLATLGFVLELLISEKELFARRPDELVAAIHAPQGLVLELHRSPPRELVVLWVLLLQLASELLTVALTRQSLFGSALVPWLQIEGVLLDVLDDVFLLDLPLEATEGTLDGLALLNLDFGHA
jgi:hypothetical protein